MSPSPSTLFTCVFGCLNVGAGRIVAESRMEITKCRGLCYLAACMADELVREMEYFANFLL